MNEKRFVFRPIEDEQAVRVLRAFRATRPDLPEPSETQLLSDRKGKPLGSKSKVYRLIGGGPADTNVIAKLADKERLKREQLVYETILPAVGLSSVACHGYREERAEEHLAWLFLEEAVGSRYRESHPVHRAAASEWIGTFHARTYARPELARTLPEVRPDHYLQYLRATTMQLRSADWSQVAPQAASTLRSIESHCAEVESRWSLVEEFCAPLPRCVVHGDVISKNARVSIGNETTRFMILDWDEVRWGVPVEDVAGLDPRVYAERLRPLLDDHDALARRIEAHGRLFRTLSWLGTLTKWLSPENLEWMLEDLALYEQYLVEARRDSRV